MAKIKNYIKKFFNWVLKHAISILLVALVFWACFLFIYQARLNLLNTVRNTQAVQPIKKPSSPPEAPAFYSTVSGIKVASIAEESSPVTAVMIENSPSARPQSGLKNSGVVYEAVAEGGITRFLVIYQAEKPGIVGPVRSLRPYYVEWLKPYDASVVHVGGSKRALDEVRNGQYRDVDQFFNGSFFWRAKDRRAPHNVYTSFEKLDQLNASKGYMSSDAKGFVRIPVSSKKDEVKGKTKQTEEVPATEISINISSNLYNSSYTYSTESKNYPRILGGVPHLDREEGQISPKVVIAMFVDEKTINEDGARENIITTGSGRAVIFQNGNVKDVTWQRNSPNDQIKFVDASGKEVPLERGQTWISAVPNGKGSVTWK